MTLFRNHFRESDIVIGKSDENLTLANEHFLPSRFFYYDELIWCIQEKKPIPVWHNFYETCNDPLVFNLITLTFFCATCSAYFLQTFEDLQPKWDFFEEAISVIGHFVGFVYPYKPKRLSNRMFYIFGLFACIIFTSSFISIMMKMMQKPIYRKSINSIEAILDSSNPPFELTGDHFALQQLHKQNEVSCIISLKIINIQLNEICFHIRLIHRKC